MGLLTLMDTLLAQGTRGDKKAIKAYFDLLQRLDPGIGAIVAGAGDSLAILPGALPAGPVKVHPGDELSPTGT